MSYSNNPYAPKARRLVVNLVTREGLSVAEAARRSGVHITVCSVASDAVILAQDQVLS